MWDETENYRLRMPESRVQRRIFGQKGEVGILGIWKKLHNEDLHNLYPSPDIISMIKSRRMRWVRNVARMQEKRNAYEAFVGEPEGKRPLSRSRRTLENIKMNLKEIGLNDVDWINLA
jgi:hypothetical protein